MSDYIDKLQEIKERRSDALNSIASSIVDKNDVTAKDAINNRYLFGDTRNTYGIFKLFDLYQQERYQEKYIEYQITDLTQGNVNSLINADLAQINSMSAPETSSSSVYKMTNNGFYKVNKDYDISVNYGDVGTSATEKPMTLSLFNNNWERDNHEYVSQYPINDLGTIYNVKNPPSIPFSGNVGNVIISNAIKTRSSSTGIYVFWGSTNAIERIIYSPGQQGEPGNTTVTFRDDYTKVWAWRTSNAETDTDDGKYIKYNYDNDQACTDFLNHVNDVINHLNTLNSILSLIVTIYTYAQDSEYWNEIKRSINENTAILNGYISEIGRIKTELTADYNTLNNTTKVQGFGSSMPSGLSSVNNAIERIRTNCTRLNNIFIDRINNYSTPNMGTLTSGLRKWINFWLTEKVSLEVGTTSQIFYLRESIRSEQEDLEKQDKRLKEITSGNVLIPTPAVRAAYSDPKFDRKSGMTTQRRIGIVWDGQFHAKKYTILRKNIKAFDYVHTDSPFYFSNNEWTNMYLDSNIPSQQGNNIKELTFPRDADETNGFLKTECLENIEDDETYIYRVYEEDGNTPHTAIDLSAITSIAQLRDPYISADTIKSSQSMLYDEDTVYYFSYIKNGVINISNKTFKKGNFILIISDIKAPEYDEKKITINGIHRIIDVSEDSIVLDNLPETIFPGKFYPVFGAVTTKNIPFINYENSELVSTTEHVYSNEPATGFGDLYVRRDGTYDLTGDWNAGNHTIINRRFEADEFNLGGIEFPSSGAEIGDVLRIDDEGKLQYDTLSDKQNATIIADVDPGILDEGQVGQFWLNVANQQLFQLVAINEGVYYWKNLSSTGMVCGDTYIHIQSSPYYQWVIDHNLGRFPSVTLVNDDNVVIEGNVRYYSEARIIVTFTENQSGKAYLNWGKIQSKQYDFVNVTEFVINDFFDESTFNKHYPSVTIVNTVGEIIEGVVEYTDNDIIKIYFSSPTSGTVYLN